MSQLHVYIQQQLASHPFETYVLKFLYIQQQCHDRAHHFVSWPARVDQVSEEDGILGARETTSCYFTRTLLDSDPLVVLVQCL